MKIKYVKKDGTEKIYEYKPRDYYRKCNTKRKLIRAAKAKAKAEASGNIHQDTQNLFIPTVRFTKMMRKMNVDDRKLIFDFIKNIKDTKYTSNN